VAGGDSFEQLLQSYPQLTREDIQAALQLASQSVNDSPVQRACGTMTVGKLQRVPLREVWPHEAYDFTAWLQENLDVLNDVTELSLSSAEREQSAGNFSVDLVAEDESGNAVVIENQLEKSNHDHLGKLITYLTALEAKTAVWIVSDPRPEHVRAITWLNESSAASFYLLKMEAVRIGDSEPAPLLTLIVGPSEEGREVGETKQHLHERHKLRHRFWTELLEGAKQKADMHGDSSPSTSSWLITDMGKRGLSFTYVIRKHDASVGISIDRRDREAGDWNNVAFEKLFANKDAIEAAFGEPLDWQRRVEGKQAFGIKRRSPSAV
jgi:hypothetical protein